MLEHPHLFFTSQPQYPMAIIASGYNFLQSIVAPQMARYSIPRHSNCSPLQIISN
jgi:hypothetical protein